MEEILCVEMNASWHISKTLVRVDTILNFTWMKIKLYSFCKDMLYIKILDHM